MSKNDVTGDNIITKVTTDKYAAGWDALWGKKKKTPADELIEEYQERFEDDVVENKK